MPYTFTGMAKIRLKSHPVSFRLPLAVFDRLRVEAERNQESPGKCGERLVTAALYRPDGLTSDCAHPAASLFKASSGVWRCGRCGAVSTDRGSSWRVA